MGTGSFFSRKGTVPVFLIKKTERDSPNKVSSPHFSSIFLHYGVIKIFIISGF